MSSEEKRTWISALVGFVVPAAYLATILSMVPSTDVAKIAYVVPTVLRLVAYPHGLVRAAIGLDAPGPGLDPRRWRRRVCAQCVPRIPRP